MLGRLVTWLRLLGYDTIYAGQADDASIAHLAQRDNRIVLTRDREMARRKAITVLLIESDQVDDQIAQVIAAYQLRTDLTNPRCALCNMPLQEIPRSEAEARVPPYVFATQSRFMECPSCHRVYWAGTHWQHMREVIQRIDQNNAHRKE